MRKIFLEDLPHRGKHINWKESIGCKTKFIYDNIQDNLIIINCYKKLINKNRKEIFVDIKYKGNIYTIRTGSLFRCKINHIVNKNKYEYKYNIGEVISNVLYGKLKILEQIRIKDKRNTTERGYKYKCLICGNTSTIYEKYLIKGRGCNVCCPNSRKVLRRINDMWTTNPDLARLLADPDEGYKYTENSNNRVDWKCSNCNNIIKNKRISNVNNFGLSCPKCGDSISYPEKFMFCMLQQLNICFVYQLTSKNLKWCNKYKYDFYFKINNIKYIIETNGAQHYKEDFESYGGRTLEEEQLNDKLKRQLAIDNKIKEENYIVIDCRKSELEWIKNNILKSKLNNIFNLSKIDWLQCHKYACNSLVKQACNLWNSGICSTKEIGKNMKLSGNTINKYLKQGTRLGWCNYDTKKINRKKIICLNNKKVFNSIRSARKYYNMSIKFEKGFKFYCKEYNHYGIDSKTKEYLQWQYYDEYLIKPKKLLSNDEINNSSKKYHVRKVVCLNNNKIFKSMRKAYEYCNLMCSNGIRKCCQGKQKSAGTDPITGEKLHWMYYEEYIKQHKRAV